MRLLSHSALLFALLVAGACGDDAARPLPGDGGADASLTCDTGETACTGGCVDLSADPDNCGACEAACSPGQICAEGECTTSCPDGQTLCGDRCYDVDVSVQNCGECDVACDEGELCSAGTCATSCGAGLTECDGTCRDVQTDRAHCGECGTACADGEICVEGACEVSCGGGLVECDGACVDTQNDRANCGGCGTACGVGEACVDGSCAVVCPAGQTECSGVCVDTDTDRANCGGCAAACDAGEICDSGSCVISCGGSTPTLCGDSCVDTDSNPFHCGDCDSPCPAGAVCSSGTCTATCGSGLTECSGACVNTAVDPAHCGDCGTTCDTATNASAVCVSSGCGLVCEAGYGDCDADLLASGGNGCETDIYTSVTNCGACGYECAIDNGTAGCAGGACTVATCDADWGDCNTDPSDGCETDVTSSAAHCGACGSSCASGEICFDSTCYPEGPSGEDCSDPLQLSPGSNTLIWRATSADYITSDPSCVTVGDVEGPDVVAEYKPATDSYTTITLNKPSSQRHAMVVSEAACGTVTELACDSEYSGTTMTVSFSATAGTSYWVYFVDTSSGSPPLPTPLEVDVTEIDCSTATTSTVSLVPADGATATTLIPTFTATFDGAVDTTSGVITLSSSSGVTRNYDLSTDPGQVSFSSGDTVMEITPSAYFPGGDTVTVSWTGLVDGTCGNAIASPTWSVAMPAASCTPAVAGTETRYPTGSSSIFTEYYVAADDKAGGWAYYGGTSYLMRMSKDGTTFEDVEALASLTSTHLGYAMLIDGDNVYTMDGSLYRISSDAGSTWTVEEYTSFPSTPSDDFRAASVYGGRIYLLTHEGTAGTPTEIWSVDAAASALPATATLESTFLEEDCSGLAMDANNYYVACGDAERLVRVDRTTDAVTLITDAFDLSTSSNALYAVDSDVDGTADLLYLKGYDAEIIFVCDPSGTSPFASPLYTFDSGLGNYGLGFDTGSDTLWIYDDGPDDMVAIQ